MSISLDASRLDSSASGLSKHLVGQRFQSPHAEALDLAGELLGLGDLLGGGAMALAVAVSAVAVGAAGGSRNRSDDLSRFAAGNVMLGQFIFRELTASVGLLISRESGDSSALQKVESGSRRCAPATTPTYSLVYCAIIEATLEPAA